MIQPRLHGLHARAQQGKDRVAFGSCVSMQHLKQVMQPGGRFPPTSGATATELGGETSFFESFSLSHTSGSEKS